MTSDESVKLKELSVDLHTSLPEMKQLHKINIHLDLVSAPGDEACNIIMINFGCVMLLCYVMYCACM